MRRVPQATLDALNSRDYTGDRRATTRVTIQAVHLGVYAGTDNQVWASIVFPGAAAPAMELPNLKSLTWQRSVDSDTASCAFELWNTAPLPPGAYPEVGDQFDQLGYYTYNRADTAFSQTAWGHRRNEWHDMIVPDRVVRVYQGYGADYTLAPERDPHMLLMGCFLINEVTYSADGLISVDCSDYARMLADQILFPPVVPLDHYPLSFDRYHQVQDPDVTITTGGQSWRKPRWSTDSNVVRLGKNGGEHGHHGTDAFDGSDTSFWMSTGNATPGQFYSFEYVEGTVSGTLNKARCKVWGGPYTVYVSVKVGGKWQGTSTIPYDPVHSPSKNKSNIPFSAKTTVPREGTVEFDLGAVANAQAVRFTFTDLFNSGIGTYPYRAGVRTMDVLTDTTSSKTIPGPMRTVGNYQDYGEIVRLLLAYGGFYWPQDAREQLTAGHVDTYHFTGGVDPYLKDGRVWADVMDSTNGPSSLDIPMFAAKPVLEGITQIRDILGYLFFIDETGAAIFRMPNLFERGNYISNPQTGRTRSTPSETIAITDEIFILGLRSKLSSRNLRERVVVADANGSVGAVAIGRFPQQVGFRRLHLWTDQNFGATTDGALADGTDFNPTEQAQVMADMIQLRRLFDYRQNAVRIPADPRIQIDDQVQLTERATGEHYLHYISGIASEWSAETGVWTYDLTTNWLGTDPEGEWAFSTTGLSPELKTYIAAIGK